MLGAVLLSQRQGGLDIRTPAALCFKHDWNIDNRNGA